VPTAPSPIRTLPASNSSKFGLKTKTSLAFVTHRAEQRGCVYRLTSSSGVCSAGVGTCHEKSLSRRLPRLLRARPSTALDERRGFRPATGPITARRDRHFNAASSPGRDSAGRAFAEGSPLADSGGDLTRVTDCTPGREDQLGWPRDLRPAREHVVVLGFDTVQDRRV
jgi:hypothetical protein